MGIPCGYDGYGTAGCVGALLEVVVGGGGLGGGSFLLPEKKKNVIHINIIIVSATASRLVNAVSFVAVHKTRISL
jgi:hypothetical protein